MTVKTPLIQGAHIVTECLPLMHISPIQPIWHEHVLGDEQVPPF